MTSFGSLWRSPTRRSYRPQVTALEDRTLLSFLPAVSYPAGLQAIAVAVADLNGDGHPDLAVADLNGGAGAVSVLLGNADGSFGPPVSYDTGGGPLNVVVGDANGDDVPDLVVANFYGPSVSLLLGNGDGSFQAARTYRPFTSGVGGLAVGDFNNDGIPDLAAGDGSVAIILNNGDGTYRLAGSFGTGYGVAAGDFNGDGNLDLVVNSFVDSRVSILLGNGDGTFQNGPVYSFSSPALDPAVGDFNGDGILDFAVTSDTGGIGHVGVFLGNGDGTFKPPTQLTAGNGPQRLTTGDFNGDGHLDLAVVNFLDNNVDVFLGNGDGSFQSALSYGSGGVGPNGVAVADVNGDGLPDLVTTNQTSNSVGVLINAGDWSRASSVGSFRARPEASPLNGNSGAASATGAIISTPTLAQDPTPSLAQAAAAGAPVSVSLTATGQPATPGTSLPAEATVSQAAQVPAASVSARPLSTLSTPEAAGSGMGDLLGDPLTRSPSPEGV